MALFLLQQVRAWPLRTSEVGFLRSESISPTLSSLLLPMVLPSCSYDDDDDDRHDDPLLGRDFAHGRRRGETHKGHQDRETGVAAVEGDESFGD